MRYILVDGIDSLRDFARQGRWPDFQSFRIFHYKVVNG